MAPVTMLAHGLVLLGFLQRAGAYSMDDVDFGDEDDDPVQDMTNMLQMSMQLTKGEDAIPTVAAPPSSPASQLDLVMTYVPYNFGHTVAKKVNEQGIRWGDCGDRSGDPSSCVGFMQSSVTGCPLMYTPGKHWPKDVAQAYFSNRTIFGILRDPYERMVAMFRGSGSDLAPDLYPTCDVNSFVKRIVRGYADSIKSGKPYVDNCNLLPQAEFFDQPYGATIAVDNRRFPTSMNELMSAHGYDQVQILTEEVDHVSGCDSVWAGDLDSEAKALVRQVYGRDFELLCNHFGYCNTLENTCITSVPGMCPSQLFAWNVEKNIYEMK